MNLDDYQWSHNPRGMHNHGYMDVQRMVAQGMGWAKLVSLEDDYVNLALELQSYNITPVIRIYRQYWGANPMDGTLERQFRSYLQQGLKWFEFYNEPNLSIEWPPGTPYDPMNTVGVIKPLCDNWLAWAEMVASYGAYPGFLALSDAGGGWENTITWINQSCLYMYENHYNRFLNILNNGFWVNTHPYILNHFYQEAPGGDPLNARIPAAQNYSEGGWHFEYPYDPICQATDPGRTVWGETPQVPLGDVHGLLGSGIAWLERLHDLFGTGILPVFGSEGGLWPLPEHNQTLQLDRRYPGFTWESHAHATVAMFDWIVEQAPPWMFGVALWKENHYYTQEGGGPYAAASLMGQTRVGYKQTPQTNVIWDRQIRPTNNTAANIPPANLVVDPPGPGPLHGRPTHHFCILAPGLGEEWFFQVGQAYFDRFKPTLMTIYEFINFMPKDTSVAVTIITPPSLVDTMNFEIARQWPTLYIDMVTAETAEQAQQILNSRVAVGRPFG